MKQLFITQYICVINTPELLNVENVDWNKKEDVIFSYIVKISCALTFFPLVWKYLLAAGPNVQIVYEQLQAQL